MAAARRSDVVGATGKSDLSRIPFVTNRGLPVTIGVGIAGCQARLSPFLFFYASCCALRLLLLRATPQIIKPIATTMATMTHQLMVRKVVNSPVNPATSRS